jgi:hypothetical protein
MKIVEVESVGKTYKLSNWWDILYYWDESLKNNKTLWNQ